VLGVGGGEVASSESGLERGCRRGGGGRSGCLDLRWHLTVFSIDSARERLCGETKAGTPVNLLGSCQLHVNRPNERVHAHSTTLSVWVFV
jgi:hypothetical protein